MEKEMFVLAKFKSGDGTFEKFMGWMQSDEGPAVKPRKNRTKLTPTATKLTPTTQ